MRIGVVIGAGVACVEASRALLAGWGAVWIGIGILAGVLLGAFIALFGRRLTSRRSGLTVEQGWEVNRAILRGEVPQDPSLVEPAREKARWLQVQSGFYRELYILMGAFGMLGIGLAVADGISGSLSAADVLRIVAWVVIVAVMRWNQLRWSEGARRAETAAGPLDGPTPNR